MPYWYSCNHFRVQFHELALYLCIQTHTDPRPLSSLLQGLELSKEFALSKSDDAGVQTAKAAIAGVNTFVEVMVICVVAVFSIFLAYAMVGRNEKVRHLVSVLARCCSSPGSTTEEAGTLGHEDEIEGKKRRCNCIGGANVTVGSTVEVMTVGV